MEIQKSKLGYVMKILIIIFIISFILSSFVSLFVETSPFGNVALIPVRGIILVDGDSTFGESVASSTDIVRFIQEADENPSTQAILLDINSPGGSAVASKEIMMAVKRTNKTTYALIREIGTSGGYWIASAADTIIADELSITGSIGVISSYLELSGLLERYNITYQRIVAGKYKDIGSPLKQLERDEEQILMGKLDKIHEYFINSVAENRNMDFNKVKTLSTGEFFLGTEALEYGLVDVLGDMKIAGELIKKDLNITLIEFAEYKKEKTFIESIAGVFSENSFLVGKGIGSALKKQETANKISIIT